MARVKLRIVRAQQHIPGGRAKEVGPPPSPALPVSTLLDVHTLRRCAIGETPSPNVRGVTCVHMLSRVACAAQRLPRAWVFFISQLAVFTVLSPKNSSLFSSFVRFFFREVCVQCMLALLTSHRRELGCNTLDARRDGRWVRSTCYARGTHVASTPL